MTPEMVLKQLEEVSYAMNRTGTLVDPVRYQKEVEASFPAAKAAPFLDVLHDDTVYGQWKVSETDLFWRCKNPPLMQLPAQAQMAIKGTHVALCQPYLYEAARLGGSSEWTSCYESGGDLLDLAATKLGLERTEAKMAVYRYLYGGVDSATTWQVESTFPWLAELVDQFEQRVLKGGHISTRYGTPLDDSLFPRASLGRYLTQTVKDLVRLGVQLLWAEHKVAPSLIVPDSVTVTNHPETLARLWVAHGLQVRIQPH